jgi:hypothetical protein
MNTCDTSRDKLLDCSSYIDYISKSVIDVSDYWHIHRFLNPLRVLYHFYNRD